MFKLGSKNLIFIIFVVVICIGIILLKLFGLFTPIQSITSGVLAPIYSPFYSTGDKIKNFFSKPANITELQNENERLREENTRFKIEITELQDDAQENLTLRQLLDFFEQDINDMPRTIARIIGKDPENSSVYILNVGQRDGVKKNNAVIIRDGVLIAKIIEVYARTSKALLLTDSQSMVAVTISGGAPTSKLARGERGLSIILDQIPQQELITIGQLVITSGLEPNIPRGLLVGEIEEVISEKNDLFQKTVLRPIYDYNIANLVTVILNKND